VRTEPSLRAAISRKTWAQMDPYAAPSVGLDRNEVGALLVAAGLGTPAEHALISLLAINGLRNSEALGADIDKLGLERRHRTQTVFREGGKIVTIQLAPRTARAIDLAIGERLEGPIPACRRRAHGPALCKANCAAGCAPGRPGQEDQPAHPAARLHHCRPRRRRFRFATCRKQPRTPTHAPPCVTTTLASPSTAPRRRAPYIVAVWLAAVAGASR
jgi:integrase/recombinase XerD